MNKEEVKQFMDKLNLIFYSMVAVPLVLFAYLYLENHAGRLMPNVSNELASTLQYVFPTLIIVVSGIGLVVPGNKIKKINRNQDLKLRLGAFQRYLLLRYSLVEVGALISIVAFYLTAEVYYSIFFMGTLILFSLNRPTNFRVMNNLEIKGDERELFK